MQFFLTHLLLLIFRSTKEEQKKKGHSVRDLPAWIRYTRSGYLKRIGVSVSDSNILENDGSLQAVTAYANFMMDNMDRRDYFWQTDNQEVRKLKKEAEMAAISAKHAFQQNPPSPPEPLGVTIKRSRDVPEPIDVRRRRDDSPSESSDSGSESETPAPRQKRAKAQKKSKKSNKTQRRRYSEESSDEKSSEDGEGSGSEGDSSDSDEEADEHSGTSEDED